MSIIDDKNGQLNSYLVRAIVGTRGIQALVNGFYYVFAALYDSVLRAKASNGKEKDQKSSDQVLALDEVGNCALFAFSQFYSLFRRLLVKDAVFNAPLSVALDRKVRHLLEFISISSYI